MRAVRPGVVRKQTYEALEFATVGTQELPDILAAMACCSGPPELTFAAVVVLVTSVLDISTTSRSFDSIVFAIDFLIHNRRFLIK